jgi:hypothetical protein
MLIKGTLNKDVLTTEIGAFKVSRKGDHQIEGVFDIETIKGESIEQTVEVNGMNLTVHVPVTKAKIKAIYTLLTKESQQEEHLVVVEDEPQSSMSLDDNMHDCLNTNLNKEMELFGRPLNNIKEFEIDHLLSRDVIQEQVDLLKKNGFVFNSSTQTYTRGE